MPICLPSFAGTTAPASGGGAFTNQYSVSFDGSDDVMTVGSISGLSGSNLSISAWFNLSSSPSNDAIIGSGTASSGSFRDFWIQVLTSTTIRFAAPGSSKQTFTLSSGSFTQNTWFHIAAVVNGTTKEVFINGTSLGTQTCNSLSGTNGTNVTIGGLPSAAFSPNPFSGFLDEVAVFSTALSTSDISTLRGGASAGTLGLPADISSLNPVGWWRMGDNNSGTGTTITDQGSGSNDGTLTNGPTFSTSVPS